MSEAARKLVELTRPAASRSASAPSVNGGQTYTPRRGTVQSVADGIAEVALDGGEGTTPCSMVVKCKAGDRVVVHIYAHEARVTGNITSPATDDEEALAARTVADEASAIAQATDQHFWHDANGAHVTDVEQDEWKQAEQEGTLVPTDEQPYHNLLMNSLGILLRRAKNVLASFSKSAVAFYDGLWDGTGDGSSHVVARFGSDGAQIGKSGETHLVQNQSGISVKDDNDDALLLLGIDDRSGEAIISAPLKNVVVYSENRVRVESATDRLSLLGDDVHVDAQSSMSIHSGSDMNIRSSYGNLSLVGSMMNSSPSIIDLKDGELNLRGIAINLRSDEVALAGRVGGAGAETLSGHNLSPFFAHDFSDRTYWYNGPSVTNLLNATSYKQDGWAHVSIPATSSATQYNIRITRTALEGVVPESEDVTLLVELANVSTEGTVEGKLVQPSNMTGELVQLSGSQDVTNGKHWFDGTTYGMGGEGLCIQLWSGTAECEFDVRVSLFKGKYRGSYKPYVVPECELQDVLGLTVESTTRVADIATAGAGFELTSAQYAVYGKMAQLTLYAKSTNALAAGTGYTVATLASGKMPLVNPSTASLGTTTAVQGTAQVGTNGSVYFRPSANVAAGTSFRINATYILA